jgi:hypothetical protein
MDPTKLAPIRLSPELERLVDRARSDVGDGPRLDAIAARLAPQLSAPTVPRVRWMPRMVVAAVVAGGVAVLVYAAYRVRTPAAPSAPQVEATATQEPTASSPPVASSGAENEPNEDVLACPCGGRRRIFAEVNEPEAIVAILSHLGMPTGPPPIARARAASFDAA